MGRGGPRNRTKLLVGRGYRRPFRPPGALLPAQFAMLITPSSIPSAPLQDGDAVPAADLAGRVLSGPGLWLDWLEELQRESLLEELLAEDVIARALREAPHGHAYERTLTAKMTVTCVLVACMFPGRGYDTALATAFGLPGLNLKPGTQVPSGPAFSKARALLGDQVMKRLFELDAACGDADLGIAALWKGLETTALDGTTMELARNDVLAAVFGIPADGARPLLRIAAHVRTATRRWIAPRSAATSTGRTRWPTTWPGPSRPASSTSPTAGSSPWTASSGSPPPAPTLPGGSRTARNPSRSRPCKPCPTGLSWSCCTNPTGCGPGAARHRRPARRTAPGHHGPAPHLHRHRPHPQRQDENHAPPGPDHPAGPRGPSRPRDRCPVRRKMADRNRVPSSEEDRPRSRRALRGQSPELARQEAWALLLIHNMTATAAARTAALAGIDPGLIPFTAVLALIRDHVTADHCCQHCGGGPQIPLPACSPPSSPSPGTVTAGSGHPAGPPPNAA